MLTRLCFKCPHQGAIFEEAYNSLFGLEDGGWLEHQAVLMEVKGIKIRPVMITRHGLDAYIM
jgi:hypothetical protein